MVANRKLPACLVAATLIAGGAAAQDGPSWRALQEQPSRPDVPPDVERPEYEFSVSRDQLMGFAPSIDEAESDSKPPAEPESLSSDVEFEAAELIPVAGADFEASDALPWVQPESENEPDATAEETFAGAESSQPEPFDYPFDTDPPPMPVDASAVAVEADSPVIDQAVGQELAAPEEARFEVSEAPGEEPDSGDAGGEDAALALPRDAALEEPTGLAFVDPAANGPSELESIDERASIAAFEPEPVAQPSEPANTDSADPESLAPAAMLEPPFADKSSAEQDLDYRLVRRRTVEPEYPRQAYRARVEGWVNLRVTVAPNGSVEAVQVTDSKPRRVFDESAIRAVRQWRFEPPRLAGVTTPQSGVYRISYTMGDR